MHPTPTQLDDDPAAIKQRRDALNVLIRANYRHLCQSTLAVVHKRCRGMKEQEKIELASETVNEAVKRVLIKAAHYDATRPPVPWLMRFILNVLKETNRENQRLRQSDLSGPAWNRILDALAPGEPSTMISQQLPTLDLALERITPEQREIVRLRFHQGLTGEQLAEAIGAPNSGAARVRLNRAVQALRGQVAILANQEEIKP